MKRFNHLTIRQLKTLKEKILAEKERILNSHAVSDEKFLIAKEDQSDDVDLANSDYENSHMLRMRNRGIFYLKKLDKALEKFDTEEYGYCEECGAEIKYERLLARPTAELCIACKEESEMEEMRSLQGRQSKSYTEVVDFASK